MNIIMLGAPGAGKGTLASEMKTRYNIPHISTGDIFRENIKNSTELGRLAKSYMDKGALVPDDVTINMVLDRLKKDDCKKGYILDGFPRTIPQAEGLTKAGAKIDLAVLVEADDDKIAERLAGRRVCKTCGAIYHTVNLKPKKDGVCDKCGGELILRKDDTPEVVKDRLKTYHESTEPLIAYYKKNTKVLSVDGFQGVEKSLASIDTVCK